VVKIKMMWRGVTLSKTRVYQKIVQLKIFEGVFQLYDFLVGPPLGR
jgi:hypothetical protein